MDGERAGRNARPATEQTSLPPARTAPAVSGPKPTAMNAAAERFAAHLHLPPQTQPSPMSAEEQALHLEQRAIELRHAERALNTRATQTRPHRPRTRSAASTATALSPQPVAPEPVSPQPAEPARSADAVPIVSPSPAVALEPTSAVEPTVPREQPAAAVTSEAAPPASSAAPVGQGAALVPPAVGLVLPASTQRPVVASPCARTMNTPTATDLPPTAGAASAPPNSTHPSPCIRIPDSPAALVTHTDPDLDECQLDDSFTTVVTLVCTCVDPSLCTCVPPDLQCTCVAEAPCTCVAEDVCTCVVSGPCTCDLGSSAIAAAVAATSLPTVTSRTTASPTPIGTPPPVPTPQAVALPPAPTPTPLTAPATPTTPVTATTPPVPATPPVSAPETPEHPAAARTATPSQAVADVLSDSPFVPWPRKVTWAGLAVVMASAAAAAPLSRNRQWRPVCPEHLSECLSSSQAIWMNVLWACGWIGLAIVVAGVVSTSWWLYKIASSATRPAASETPQCALVGGVTWLLHTVLVYLTVPFAYMGWLVSNIGLVAASTAAALAHGLLLERTLKSDIIRLSPGSAHTLAAATTVSTAVLGWILTSRGFPLWLLAPVAGLCFAAAALTAHHGTHATARPNWANRTYLLRGTVAAAFAVVALAGPVLWWMTGTSGRLIGAPGWTTSGPSVAKPVPSAPAPGTPSVSSTSAPAPGTSAPCLPAALSMTTTTWDINGAQHSVLVTVRNTSGAPCSIAATPVASVKITGRRNPVATSAAAPTTRIELPAGATRTTTLSWAPAVSGTMTTQYLYLGIGPQPEPVPVRLNRWPHPFDVVVGTKLTATPWR